MKVENVTLGGGDIGLLARIYISLLLFISVTRGGDFRAYRSR